MDIPAPLRRVVYATWKRTPKRLRRLAVRVVVPRAPLGAGVLLFDSDGRLLLVRPSYYRRPMWTLPGGWANRGEDLRATAVREAREELGAEVEAGAPLATGRGPFGEVTVVFEGRWRSVPAVQRLDAEIAEARYFECDALPPMLPPARDLIEEALAVSRRLRSVPGPAGEHDAP
ncbi:MAG: NUDIX hydrolase [Dehalococcoidia bacterium]